MNHLEVGSTKDKPCMISWSKTHPTLAICMEKGGVVFYNKRTKKEVSTMGKHTKKIISASWGMGGMLITGGEDR